MENLHLEDGGDITRCNMFAELCGGYRCGFQLKSRVCFSVSQPSQAENVQAEMWVGWHVCTATCTFAVLSAGCAVIHSVTMNTYCEKERELPHVLS